LGKGVDGNTKNIRRNEILILLLYQIEVASSCMTVDPPSLVPMASGLRFEGELRDVVVS